MKIKGPPIPPSQKGPDSGNKANLQKATNQVASALAGLAGSKDEIQKKKQKEKTEELQQKDERQVLKEFGKECGVKKDDTKKAATKKLVNGVLKREYNDRESGYQKMVDEISNFVQEQNPELKDRFNQWIETIQKEL